MRKILLLTCLCALSLSASGQLKVQSDGKVAIQTTSTALSPISINGAGNYNYYISCNTQNKNGIRLTTSGNVNGYVYGGEFNTSSGYQAVGLKGYATSSENCFGVMGLGHCGTKTIGVYGDIYYTTRNGAAIYGTIHNDYGSALPTNGTYAGFFNGNVNVIGNITATTINGIALGPSSSGSGSSVNSFSLRSASIANSLSGLNVTTYQKERPAQPQTTESVYGLDGDTLRRGEAPEPDIMDEQFYDKNHYALDADRLEEIFPDLVYIDKDGNKVISYMEMIPLLVQSINELNAKIAQLSKDNVRQTRSAFSDDGDGFSSLASKNILYQNTPNPFKEQTTIRFSLADDVTSAAICIFDMSGKMLKKLPVSSGDGSVTVNGWELGEGLYLYSLVVNGREIDTKKMIITK